MNEKQITDYLRKNQVFLYGIEPCDPALIEALMKVSDEQIELLNQISFKKPSTVQLIAIFPGIIGIDRFYMKDIALGCLKYITFGGIGIWWIADIFTAKKRCRKCNAKILLKAISDPATVTAHHSNIKLDPNQVKKIIQLGKTLKQGAKDFQDSLDVK